MLHLLLQLQLLLQLERVRPQPLTRAVAASDAHGCSPCHIRAAASIQPRLHTGAGILRGGLFDLSDLPEGEGAVAEEEGALALLSVIRAAGAVVIIGFLFHQTLPRLSTLVSRLLQ